MSFAGEIELNHPIDFMRLTLTYRGPLHAQTNRDGRVAEKHAIRRQFHMQMQDAWRTHPSLEAQFKKLCWRLNPAGPPPQTNLLRDNPPLEAPGTAAAMSRQIARLTEDDAFIQFYDVGPFKFVPLVNQGNWLAADLDILFLRREPAGHIIDGESGDIDNRVKVLFDALRMPLAIGELPSQAAPQDDEKPFFCLLENDSLITGFRLESDRLLYPPATSDAEVQLTIRVQIKAIRVTWGNLPIID